MTEDFLGCGGKLEEQFVPVVNNKLVETPFQKLEIRAIQEKPQLLPGLGKLKAAMGEAEFDRLINSLHNINLGENAVLMLAAGEQARTALMAQWLPAIRTAFGVDNVRIVGGGRYGLDAF